jgi:hypothetical protein
LLDTDVVAFTVDDGRVVVLQQTGDVHIHSDTGNSERYDTVPIPHTVYTTPLANAPVGILVDLSTSPHYTAPSGGQARAVALDGGGRLVVLSSEGRLYDYGTPTAPTDPIEIARHVQAFDVAADGSVVAAIDGVLFKHTTPGSAGGWTPLDRLNAYDPASWLSDYFLPAYQAATVPDYSGQSVLDFSLEVTGNVLSKKMTFVRDIEGHWVQGTESWWISNAKYYGNGLVGVEVGGAVGPTGISGTAGFRLGPPQAGVTITVRALDTRDWLTKAADEVWAWLEHIGEEIAKIFAKINQETIRNSGQGGGGPSVTGTEGPDGTISYTIQLP